MRRRPVAKGYSLLVLPEVEFSSLSDSPDDVMS